MSTTSPASIRLLGVPRLLRYAVICWTFYEFLMLLRVGLDLRLSEPALSHLSTLIYCLLDGCTGVLLTLGAFAFVDVMARRPRHRLAEHVIYALFLVVTVVILCVVEGALRSWLTPGQTFTAAWLITLCDEFFDTLLVVAFLIGFGQSLRTWAADRKRRDDEAELQAAVVSAELDALAASMQPIFVSHALAEISAVMKHDVPRARRLIAQLAETLRGMLNRAPDGEAES
jgi:hypothetical protein